MNIEDVIAAAIVIAGVGALLAIWCAVVSWAIRDANKRGKTGCFMLVLFWLFGPLAVIVWLMIRPTQLTHRRPDSYATPDDALAAASRMDMLGDWDAAIALYEFVGRQLPGASRLCRRFGPENQGKASAGMIALSASRSCRSPIASRAPVS